MDTAEAVLPLLEKETQTIDPRYEVVIVIV